MNEIKSKRAATDTKQANITKSENMKIAPNAYDNKQNLLPIFEQLLKLMDKEKDFGIASLYIGSSLDFAGIDNEYLCLTTSSLKHIFTKHEEIDLKILSDILERIPYEVVLATDYIDKYTLIAKKAIIVEHKKIIYIIGISHNLIINRRKLKKLVVDQIKTIYKKEDISSYLDKNSNIYKNEKSNDFLARSIISVDGDAI